MTAPQHTTVPSPAEIAHSFKTRTALPIAHPASVVSLKERAKRVLSNPHSSSLPRELAASLDAGDITSPKFGELVDHAETRLAESIAARTKKPFRAKHDANVDDHQVAATGSRVPHKVVQARRVEKTSPTLSQQITKVLASNHFDKLDSDLRRRLQSDDILSDAAVVPTLRAAQAAIKAFEHKSKEKKRRERIENDRKYTLANKGVNAPAPKFGNGNKKKDK